MIINQKIFKIKIQRIINLSKNIYILNTNIIDKQNEIFNSNNLNNHYIKSQNISNNKLKSVDYFIKDEQKRE